MYVPNEYPNAPGHPIHLAQLPLHLASGGYLVVPGGAGGGGWWWRVGFMARIARRVSSPMVFFDKSLVVVLKSLVVSLARSFKQMRNIY